MKIKRIRHRSYHNYGYRLYCTSNHDVRGGKKDSYYGIMKDSTTIDKMINTKNEKNVELPKDANVSVKKKIL